MYQAPLMVATKSACNFEQFMRRPVYKVQCFTTRIARQLVGIHVPNGQGLASAMDAISGLHTFRCLSPYRDDAGKLLRARVARHIRTLRAKSRTLML